MTKRLLSAAIVLGIATAFAAIAADESVTLQGDMLCAKCTLKDTEYSKCQNVVQVKGEKGEPTNYYVVANDVAEKYGHTCKGTKPVTITGKVSEKDGKKWITAEKIEEKKG
jgi:hypothetical protein